MSTRYKVYIAPRRDILSYDSEIDVSDYIRFDGIGKISKSIDSTDYTIGIFVSSDLELTGINYNGYFNDESDTRSIFKFTRDLAKVRVVFSNSAGDTIQFRGLLNEAATRLNTENSKITFKILSLDSVLRTTNIPSGVVSDGMTCSAAMKAILNQPAITATLGFNASNINPDLDFIIDYAAALEGVSVQEGMNQLLIASNSAMLIDDSGNIMIQNRLMIEDEAILNLYGPYDIYGRQNTISLTDFNSGKQRMFNSFVINNQIKENDSYVTQYGFNQKTETFAFITDDATSADIAARLLSEFQFPKMECQIDIPVSLAPSIKLLDAISVNWPLLIKPITGKFFPVIGVTKIGDSTMPLPYVYGNIEIRPNVAWKIIQITDDPKRFVRTLKLRQAGTSIQDGYFTKPGSNRIDFAVIGDARIGGDNGPSYNPSIIGAAKIGYTNLV